MKRLIVCFDGTWNNPEQEDNGIPAPTNVYKIHNAILDIDSGSGIKQLKYYHPGLGGEDSGIFDAIVGGAIGSGIARHICSAYHWLAKNYEDGDEIYLFGFSRGAFTVRSLSGMLNKGLLDLTTVDDKKSWQLVDIAFKKGYRNRATNVDSWADSSWAFFNQRKPLPIHFIGVWDTVGALGIPDDLELFNLFDDKNKWQFHDTSLGENIKCARHAMAIDEIRTSFSLTRWSKPNQHNNLKEVWFPGVHSDVGGGYADCDLSNAALKWMIEESTQQNLKFRDNIAQTIKDNPLGIMHNSYKGIFAKLRSRPRNVDAMVSSNKDIFHSSSLIRQVGSPIEFPPYHPTKLLALNEEVTVDIYADTHWNNTGIFLDAGCKYKFTSTGTWQDSKDTCDWKGTQNSEFTKDDVIRAAGTFLGKFEPLFKRFTKNESTDFLGTKRVEDFNWFTLVGAITNDADVKTAVNNDGSAVPHQYIDLPEHEINAIEIDSPGYLYCFANDVWSLYGNNHGSIKLTVIRTQ